MGGEKQKALVVATKCTSVEQFVSTFHRFCDQWSFFVATMASRPVGLETAFSIQLENKTPVLRGLCTVVEAWATPANRFGRPGVRLEVKRLTKESVPVFEALQNARKAAEAAAVPAPPTRPSQMPAEPPAAERDTSAAPEPVPTDVDLTNPIATETRTPGSSFVLPANPLMNLTDASLEGFVDCALYEETANFFRAPEDDGSLVELGDTIDPPAPERRSQRTLAPANVLKPTAFLRPDDDFVPEHTPLPELAGFVPARAVTPPPVPATPPAGPAPAPPPVGTGAPMFGPPGAYVPAATATSPMRSPVDSTENLLAIAQRRDRKRWLVIGGAAAGGSLLLLIVVLAIKGSGDDKTAAAATSSPPSATAARAEPDPGEPDRVEPDQIAPPKGEPDRGEPDTVAPPRTEPTRVAKVVPPKAETPALTEAIDDTTSGDPNAPPVVGSGPCSLTVTSSPAGSIVSVDQQPIGPSPITVAGPCTKRRVDVKHPRYALGTRWVTLSEGTPGSVDLTLARPTHSVTVTSMPSGATVSIAGRRAGTTPTQVKVMGFTGVTITVEKKGYKTVSQKLYSKVENDSVKVILVRGR
ncbi:MAG: PEGA domain-containing protein [Myxococcales bacterium]|nr:PEGA domain-containing protein [Myxococcales bacterium]